jgi:hypothetical protein
MPKVAGQKETPNSRKSVPIEGMGEFCTRRTSLSESCVIDFGLFHLIGFVALVGLL